MPLLSGNTKWQTNKAINDHIISLAFKLYGKAKVDAALLIALQETKDLDTREERLAEYYAYRGVDAAGQPFPPEDQTGGAPPVRTRRTRTTRTTKTGDTARKVRKALTKGLLLAQSTAGEAGNGSAETAVAAAAALAAQQMTVAGPWKAKGSGRGRTTAQKAQRVSWEQKFMGPYQDEEEEDGNKAKYEAEMAEDDDEATASDRSTTPANSESEGSGGAYGRKKRNKARQVGGYGLTPPQRQAEGMMPGLQWGNNVFNAAPEVSAIEAGEPSPQPSGQRTPPADTTAGPVTGDKVTQEDASAPPPIATASQQLYVLLTYFQKNKRAPDPRRTMVPQAVSDASYRWCHERYAVFFQHARDSYQGHTKELTNDIPLVQDGHAKIAHIQKPQQGDIDCYKQLLEQGPHGLGKTTSTTRTAAQTVEVARQSLYQYQVDAQSYPQHATGRGEEETASDGPHGTSDPTTEVSSKRYHVIMLHVSNSKRPTQKHINLGFAISSPGCRSKYGARNRTDNRAGPRCTPRHTNQTPGPHHGGKSTELRIEK
jgi:hypothetical protein